MSAFNSLSHARQLEAAGVPRPQAEVHAQLNKVEAKTDRLIERLTQFEINLSANVADLKTSMVEFKNEFVNVRTEMSALRASHQHMMWISGGMATVCLTALGLCIPLVLHALK